MLRKAIAPMMAAALSIAWLGAAFPAYAQGLPDFPQTVSPSTVLGRMPGTSGPVQAIPFATLTAQLNGLSTVVYGPASTTVGDLVTWGNIVGTSALDSGIAVTGTGSLAFGTGNGLTIGTSGGTLSIASGTTLTDTSAQASKLLLGAAGGGFTGYAGTSCSSGQSFISLSTAGAVTCAAKAATNSTAASPTAPNSTSSFKMQGLAGTITPAVNGNVLITISGTVINSSGTINTGLKYQISYGTGTAPTSNAALAGTQAGVVQSYTNPVAVTAADVNVPFSISVVVTGLTLNTAYWIDLAAESITSASTGALSNVNISANEI